MSSVAIAEGGEEERRRILKVEQSSASIGHQISAESKSKGVKSSTIISRDGEREKIGSRGESRRGVR